MATVCPVCNGLYYKELSCPKCAGAMIDKGILEGFMEPYRPYLDGDILEKIDGVPYCQCLHLFACLDCGYDQHLSITKIQP